MRKEGMNDWYRLPQFSSSVLYRSSVFRHSSLEGRGGMNPNTSYRRETEQTKKTWQGNSGKRPKSPRWWLRSKLEEETKEEEEQSSRCTDLNVRKKRRQGTKKKRDLLRKYSTDLVMFSVMTMRQWYCLVVFFDYY